jgi:hypothetical protein
MYIISINIQDILEKLEKELKYIAKNIDQQI